LYKKKVLGCRDDDHLAEGCFSTRLGFDARELGEEHVDDASFVGAEVGKNNFLL
jgi:hypothetical protein